VEITTIVLEGEIAHEDNMGNRCFLGEGMCSVSPQEQASNIQSLTGERNLCIYTRSGFLRPETIWNRHTLKRDSRLDWKNRLLPLVSGQSFENVLKINADATVYRASLEKGHTLHFDSRKSRFVFIYLCWRILCQSTKAQVGRPGPS
jgi:hypothetical protein